MLFKISNVGRHYQLQGYLDSIRNNTNLDVITSADRDEWASSVARSDITSENNYLALFGVGDIMIIQDLIGYPVVIDRDSDKPRIRILDNF